MANEFEFSSGAIPPDRALALRGLAGTEEISRLFSFDLLLAHEGPLQSDEIRSLFDAPCAVALGSGPGATLRGIVTRVRTLPRLPGSEEVFESMITMAPTLHLLTLATNNRVFQGIDLADPNKRVTGARVVEALLRQYDLWSLSMSRFDISDQAHGREYAVQYGESDWDFAQRRLEHEGTFYFFEHESGSREVLVVADSNGAATDLDPIEVRYEENDLGSPDGRIYAWQSDHRRVPARVAVFDYHESLPQLRLGAKEVVGDGSGFGSAIRFGEHLEFHEEAAAIARVRAEQIAWGAKVFTGTSDCRRLRAGHVFELAGHPQDDGRYLLISVEHRGGYAPGGGAEEPYRASFRAIPIDVPFRPELRTPWPRIHGLMHGHVSAATDGTYAELDALGRYRVKMTFDTRPTRGAHVSLPIRMAQGYAGTPEGRHHPLRKGTEVFVAYVEGDPDRPVIVGAVPNPLTISPTTSANATQSVVQSASGIRLELEDNQSGGS